MGLFLSIILTFAALAYLGFVLQRSQSAFLGFTVYNVFLVASASLSGLVFALLTGCSTEWVTVSHLEVFNDSALGLLAMGTGIWLGWRRREPGLFRGKADAWPFSDPPWINPYFVYTCLVVGCLGGVLDVQLRGVPTFGTVANSLTAFVYIGLLVSLWLALSRRKALPLLISGAVVAVTGIANVVASGFIGNLMPAVFQSVLIMTMRRKVSIPRLGIAGFVLALLIYPYAAWFDVRNIVRSGSLENVGFVTASERLVGRFTSSIDPREEDAESLLDLVLGRLDASSILAAQVEYQPAHEPFAYGRTITDNLLPALVPRFLWPEKPLVAGGSAFVTRYTGLAWRETSVGAPYQFEFYANGGKWAVVLGLFFIGWLSARLESSLFIRELRLRKLLPLFVAVVVVCNGGQRMYLSLMSLITGMLGAYLAGVTLEVMLPDFARLAAGQPAADLEFARSTGALDDRSATVDLP